MGIEENICICIYSYRFFSCLNRYGSRCFRALCGHSSSLTDNHPIPSKIFVLPLTFASRPLRRKLAAPAKLCKILQRAPLGSSHSAAVHSDFLLKYRQRFISFVPVPHFHTSRVSTPANSANITPWTIRFNSCS